MITLWLEPFGGLAGDMFLAALLDLGDERFDLEELRALAEALVPGECELALYSVKRKGLRAAHLELRTPESDKAPARRLNDLIALVRDLPVSEAVARRSEGCFTRLAQAEARAHGCGVQDVHFHEVGAVDTLVDVCGAFLALERLGVERVLATPPLVGSGTVRCAHGEMPVPAPGTAELLAGLPSRPGGGGERLTPTGAALLAEIAPEFVGAEGALVGAAFVQRAVGYGAGSRDPAEGPPNLLRVRLGESPGADALGTGAVQRGLVWLCEFNLDDATGEEIGYCLERLRAAGALEAWTHSVQMKKDRPGVVVSALCRSDSRAELEREAFAHTSTLGLRWREQERSECEREHVSVTVAGRKVRAVVRRSPDGRALRRGDISPEYDDLADLARENGAPLREWEEIVRDEVWKRRSSE